MLTARFAASKRSKLYCSAAARPSATVEDRARLMKTPQNPRSSALSAVRRSRSANGARKMMAPGRYAITARAIN